MAIESGGLPTVREELNRKTFETVEWLFDRVRAGLLSEEQFATGIDAVFQTASGLVDDQILEVVSAAEALSGHEPKTVRRRVFAKNDDVLVVTWTVSEDYFTATRMSLMEHKVKRLQYDTAGEACASYAKLVDKLLATGWKEIE